jgi:hypothetical protein
MRPECQSDSSQLDSRCSDWRRFSRTVLRRIVNYCPATPLLPIPCMQLGRDVWGRRAGHWPLYTVVRNGAYRQRTRHERSRKMRFR